MSTPPHAQPVKPPFTIPTMAEIGAARGTAGLSVVSTFAGCGGSCLGFEMAGYRVLWANEFLPIARASYAANHPDTILDGRDIRQVEAQQILDAIGMQSGELDVFNGSPPCQAFSSAGQGSKGWGKSRDYGNGVSQKNEDLFFDYIRLVRGLQPRVFVAENVAGLTRGAAIGMFKIIMRELAGCGYAVRCKILDAQWLGVPQSRSRAIFIGVRKDLGLEPEFPTPLPYRYTLREVLPGLRSVVHDTRTPSFSAGDVTDRPCPAITIGVNSLNSCHYKVIDRGCLEIDPATPNLPPSNLREWKRLRPGEQSGKFFSLIRASPDRPAPCITFGKGGTSASHCNEPRKFSIDELRIICSFPQDFVLKGTYAEQWARLGNAVPPLMMRAVAETLRDRIFSRIQRAKTAPARPPQPVLRVRAREAAPKSAMKARRKGPAVGHETESR